MSTLRMPSRNEVPFELVDAAAFADNIIEVSPLEIIKMIKSERSIWKPLNEAIGRVGGEFRPRDEGHWELAYFWFITTPGTVTVKPWLKIASKQSRVWRACGFKKVPSYRTVWRGFAELEEYEPEFEKMLQRLVYRARQHEPAIGAWLHVDSTEGQTHGQTRHDESCGCGRIGVGIHRVSQDDAAHYRHAEHEDRSISGLVVSTRGSYTVEERETRDGQRRKYQLIESGGHIWRSIDPDAGLRSYQRPNGISFRHWHGYYITPATDHVTGIPVAIRVHRADLNESALYPTVIEHASRVIGAYPIAVAADRGFSYTDVFKWNTERAIASVIPWRAQKNKPYPAGTDEWDEHGVPRCRSCGRATDHAGFVLVKSPTSLDPHHTKPVLRFTCALPSTPECLGEQSISPAKAWKRLLPIWRTHDTYQELRQTHQQYERVHEHLRSAYSVGPDATTNRPRRVGLGCQQLRATSALIIDWYRFCTMHGWFGTPRRVTRKPIRRFARREKMRTNIETARRARGLIGGNSRTKRLRFAAPPKGSSK